MNPAFLLVWAALAGSAPTGVQDVLYARPVTLDTPHPYPWRKDHPAVRDGTLLVLLVDPALSVPRDVNVPVLYAGDTPVERVNNGWPSGRLVVFVPGEVDPATVPFFFGDAVLPERVDAAHGREEMAEALAAGIAPFGTAKLAAVQGPALHVTDSAAFHQAAADLVLRYAPDDADHARGMR